MPGPFQFHHALHAHSWPATGPAVVFVYATWCGYSQAQAPKFDEAAQRLAAHGIKAIALNGEKTPLPKAVQHSLKGFPTLYAVAHDGKVHMIPDGTLKAAQKALAR